MRTSAELSRAIDPFTTFFAFHVARVAEEAEPGDRPGSRRRETSLNVA